MQSSSLQPFTYWLPHLQGLLYGFLDRTHKGTLEALLVALEGFLVAVEAGMVIPSTTPQIQQEATTPALWWEKQVQEAVTMFRVRPTLARLENVEIVAKSYMDWKTTRK